MTGYFMGNKMNNLFNRFDGKTADIHQENRVELANLSTHIPPYQSCKPSINQYS